MRIIAGTDSSRKLEAPKGMHTRPTLDKVREAVFSSLGGRFDGGVFADLYAGSGANGLEALSRGCDTAVFAEKAKPAVQAIRNNIRSLHRESQCIVYAQSVEKTLHELSTQEMRLDYVYMDPPYEQEKNDWILHFLDDHRMMKPGGMIIVESQKEDTFPDVYTTFQKKKEAVYGITKITYYKVREEAS